MGLFALVFGSFLDGASWAQSSNVKDVLVAWRKRLKKGLGSWDLKVGCFSSLVVYLEKEEPTDF